MLEGSQATAVYSTLKDEFQKGIDVAKPVSQELFESIDSDGANNIYSWFDVYPTLRRWYKGQSRALRNITERSYTVPNLKFETTISVSQDDINDKQISSHKINAKALGKSGELLPDKLVFDLLNYGFSTTNANGDSVACYDDLAWFSNSHVVGESTIDNLTTLVLNVENYRTIYSKMLGYTVKADKMSELEPLNAGGWDPVLVCGPLLRNTARDILEKPNLTGGESNAEYGTAKLLVSPFITSSTYWFLLNVGGLCKPIYFQDREGLQYEEKTPANDNEAFMHDSLIVGVKRRCNALATFPWLAIGSTGAATSE